MIGWTEPEISDELKEYYGIYGYTLRLCSSPTQISHCPPLFPNRKPIELRLADLIPIGRTETGQRRYSYEIGREDTLEYDAIAPAATNDYEYQVNITVSYADAEETDPARVRINGHTSAGVDQVAVADGSSLIFYPSPSYVQEISALVPQPGRIALDGDAGSQVRVEWDELPISEAHLRNGYRVVGYQVQSCLAEPDFNQCFAPRALGGEAREAVFPLISRMERMIYMRVSAIILL